MKEDKISISKRYKLLSILVVSNCFIVAIVCDVIYATGILRMNRFLVNIGWKNVLWDLVFQLI